MAVYLIALVSLTSGCQETANPAAEWLALIQDANEQTEGDFVDAQVAIETLTEAFNTPVPEAISATDSRVIRQDLCYRLSDLALSGDDPDTALSWAEAGLALGVEDDLFSANLLVVKGRALEHLGREIDAAAVYVEALRINRVLLDEVMSAVSEEGE